MVETDTKVRDFVSSISEFRPMVFNHLITWYLDESTTLDLSELKSGTLFELDDITYQYAGEIKGVKMFRQLGKDELIELPGLENTRVRRVF